MMDRKNSRKIGLVSTASALAISLVTTGFVIAPAIAQENSEPEVIIVTGSNIRAKQDFQAPSPVQTVDQAALANTATVRLQDVFKGLTVNSGSQTSNRQNDRQGLSQFSLRGLGIGSTLTLVNGRRAGLAPVTDDTGQLFTDSNQFPVNMIERIEVLTDGASATYGSEAVAGVVNVITRTDFEGIEITGEARTSTHDSYQIGGAFGTSFDRGHVSAFVNYYNQGGNSRGDFDFIRNRDADNTDGIGAVFSSGTGSPDDYQLAVVDATSQGGYDRVGTAVADPHCVEAQGQFRGGTSCRYPFIDQRRLIAAEDRFQMFSQLDYDLTDRIDVFGEFSFSRNEITDHIGGGVMRQNTTDGGFLIPASHPFNFFVSDGAGGIQYMDPTDATNATNWANGTLTAVDLITRTRPLGRAYDGDNAAEIDTVFTNYRAVAGFDFELNDDWLWHGSYTYSNSEFTRNQPRDYNVTNYQAAISSGAWNPFGISIANPTFLSPRDGVSVSGNSAQDLALFDEPVTWEGGIAQTVFETSLSGVTGWEMGGGNVAVAIGAQYREIDFEYVPDGKRQSGNNARAEVEAAVYGDQTAVALYGEALFPITDRLEAQAAIRFEDYGDDGGSTTDPKISAKYDVTDQFALRASWGTSFQAPSIRQTAGAVGNEGVIDPLNPTAGSFNVTVFTQGADDLKPQSADNLNVGAVFDTDFGLQASIDYWTYHYEDLILPGGNAQSIVDAVAAGTLPASRVVRDASGQLNQVFTGFLNRGDVDASGIDIAAYYSPDIWEFADVTFDASSTIITEYDSSEFGDIKGNRNSGNGFGSTPDFKLNLGATLDKDAHNANVSLRHIGEYKDDQSGNAIESQTTVDLRYSYEFAQNFLSGDTTLTIGLVNMFDEEPPQIDSRPLFDTEVHDPRGRQFYIGFKHKFN